MDDPFYEAIRQVRDAVHGLLGPVDSVNVNSVILPDADSPAMREISQQRY
jgi:hypothetical protein